MSEKSTQDNLRYIGARNPEPGNLMRGIGEMLQEIRAAGLVPLRIALGKETHALLNAEIAQHLSQNGYRNDSLNPFSDVKLNAKPANDTWLRIACSTEAIPEKSAVDSLQGILSAGEPQKPVAAIKLVPPDLPSTILPIKLV
jgi:hypothetical protein